jgi:hypothetical protein
MNKTDRERGCREEISKGLDIGGAHNMSHGFGGSFMIMLNLENSSALFEPMVIWGRLCYSRQFL